jgi:hypothetical protein
MTIQSRVWCNRAGQRILWPAPVVVEAMPSPPTKATQLSRTFRLEYATRIEVRATPQRIWSLLTNAAEFPRWNSTVTRIAGTIAEGERLALEVAAAPGRTFKPGSPRSSPSGGWGGPGAGVRGRRCGSSSLTAMTSAGLDVLGRSAERNRSVVAGVASTLPG